MCVCVCVFKMGFYNFCVADYTVISALYCANCRTLLDRLGFLFCFCFCFQHFEYFSALFSAVLFLIKKSLFKISFIFKISSLTLNTGVLIGLDLSFTIFLVLIDPLY